jgi:hypothetical protein
MLEVIPERLGDQRRHEERQGDEGGADAFHRGAPENAGDFSNF